MMRDTRAGLFMRQLIFALALVLAGLVPAAAETRIALVIGNDRYETFRRLSNPVRDAEAVGAALRAQGFQVTVATDRTLEQMNDDLRAHRNRLRVDANAVGVVYFAGHGVEWQGRNYLVPIDADPADDADLPAEAIRLDALFTQLRAANNDLNFVFIDACRDNPLPPASGLFAGSDRSATQGFADIVTPDANLKVLFSALPRARAADGAAGNGSPFANAFVRAVTAPGRSWTETLGDITTEVARSTGSQVPHFEGVLAGADFCFAGCAAPVAPLLPDPRLEELERERARAAQLEARLAELEAPRQPAPAAPAPGPRSAPGAATPQAVLRSLAPLGPSFRTHQALPSVLAEISFDELERFSGRETPESALAALLAGRGYQDGIGVTKDAARAVALYRQACDAGQAVACANLGIMYDYGRGVEKDVARAATLYRQACDAGVANACNMLGWMYVNGSGVAQDDVRAVAVYRQACDGGEPNGCANLGFMYEKGRGVRTDSAAAAALFRQACDAQDAYGCSGLGAMYAEGRGVTKDEARGVELYRQACEAGHPNGCVNLGKMYAEGRGVGKDQARAVRLYREACDEGFKQGCHELGRTYLYGWGVIQDNARALDLFGQACDAGVAVSCIGLGVMYEEGSGVRTNRRTAIGYYRQALSLDPGNTTAISNLRALGVEP